jgi:hypothetical protein
MIHLQRSEFAEIFTVSLEIGPVDPAEDEDHSLTFALLASTSLRMVAPNHSRFNASPQMNGNGKSPSPNGKAHASKAH